MSTNTHGSRYTQQNAPTMYVNSTTDHTRFAYRRFGGPTGHHESGLAAIPLLLLIHFRGTMDWWDPRFVNNLAAEREVILVDYPGVGKSSGYVATTAKATADQVLEFLSLIHVKELDVLGFSIGGFIAPMVYLNSPSSINVRKLVVAGTSPSAGPDLAVNSPERNANFTRLASSSKVGDAFNNGFNTLFFNPTNTSQAAGQAWFNRVFERNKTTSGEERSPLLPEPGLDNHTAIIANWFSDKDRELGDYDRLKNITIPTLIGQGYNDYTLPSVNSFWFQQKTPDSRLKMFPDSGHAFLYQFADEFARDVNQFLTEAQAPVGV